MPKNKKQHFVPKFYLKNFASKGIINLINLNDMRVINRIQYKDQCYEDYFYGKNLKVEKTLGDIETITSPVFNKIIDNNLPLEDKDRFVLLFFMLLQFSRTKKQAEDNSEMVDKLLKELMSNEFSEDKISSCKIEISNSPVFSISIAIQLIEIILDLSYVILNNDTHIDFVTSDNPVVKHNQYLYRLKELSTTGLACKGLLVFMPINSKKLVMLYDSDVYKILSKDNVAKISDYKDIINLNTIQLLNSDEVIYFTNEKNSKSLSKWVAREKNKKVKDNIKIKSYVNMKDSKESIIHCSNSKLELERKLRFVKLSEKYMRIKEEDRVWEVRNPVVVDAHEEFMNGVEKGQYSREQFLDFLLKWGS